jgi:hypothetical protein
VQHVATALDHQVATVQQLLLGSREFRGRGEAADFSMATCQHHTEFQIIGVLAQQPGKTAGDKTRPNNSNAFLRAGWRALERCCACAGIRMLSGQDHGLD